MDKLKLMRLNDDMLEDALRSDEIEEDTGFVEKDKTKQFKDKYKEFYDDIKISHKEDW